MSATVAVCFSGPRRELHHNYRLNQLSPLRTSEVQAIPDYPQEPNDWLDRRLAKW